MPTRMTFTVEGLDELRQQVNTAPELMLVTQNDGLRDIGRLFVPSKGTGPLADATPKGPTKKLSRSTFFQITGSPGNQTLVILQPARTPPQYDSQFYGEFQRRGTRAHIIRPRHQSVLRFEVQGGEVVFASQVQHPGTKPNPYHIRVLNRLQPRIQAIIDRIKARVVAHFS